MVCPDTCIEHYYPVLLFNRIVSPLPENPGTLHGITRLEATFSNKKLVIAPCPEGFGH